MTEDQASVTVAVLSNDTDPDLGDTPANFAVVSPLGALTVTPPAGVTISNAGSAAIVGNQIQFTPSSDYQKLKVGETATVKIVYTMKDDDAPALTSTATLTIMLLG